MRLHALICPYQRGSLIHFPDSACPFEYNLSLHACILRDVVSQKECLARFFRDTSIRKPLWWYPAFVVQNGTPFVQQFPDVGSEPDNSLCEFG